MNSMKHWLHSWIARLQFKRAKKRRLNKAYQHALEAARKRLRRREL